MELMNIGNKYYGGLMDNTVSNMTINKVTDSIKKVKDDSTDEELMAACKSFESYMLEQVMAKMEQVAHVFNDKDDKENQYVSMFKDTFIKDMSEKVTENTDFGIAKMLYDSMRRNTVMSEKQS